jgi:hypothetical protein
MSSDGAPGGYSGYRFLQDTANDRQYSVRYENDRPVKPVKVFAATAEAAVLKPNETVFALDDESDLVGDGGKAQRRVMAFQLEANANGEVQKLKVLGIVYDLDFRRNADKTVAVTYQLSQDSAAQLAACGFSKDFPRSFADVLEESDYVSSEDGKGARVDARVLGNLAFPPHHEGGALIARQSVPGMPAAKADLTEGGKYSKLDAQTLQETKPLGGKATLRLLFNFETQRVTEIYKNSTDKTVAITSNGFDGYSAESLEKAFNKLTAMGGKPSALPENLPSALHKMPKPGLGGSGQ